MFPGLQKRIRGIYFSTFPPVQPRTEPCYWLDSSRFFHRNVQQKQKKNPSSCCCVSVRSFKSNRASQFNLSEDGAPQGDHLCGLVRGPPLPAVGREEPSQARCGQRSKASQRKARKRKSESPPERCGTSARSGVLRLFMLPAAGIFIDFAQVDVPFVPVDFLHSETTRGHVLQLPFAV